MPDVLGNLKTGENGILNAASSQIGRIDELSRKEPKKNFQNIWEKSNTSYSGCDINAIISLNGKLLQIGNLSTLSYSIHREKSPIRTLGRIYPKGYVRGPLTIAGSLIFTVFDQHVLAQLRDVFDFEHNISDLQKSLLTHQFPPFDIVVTYTNEYGHQSYLRIYGVDIIDEGQTHSVNDMVSENMMQYVAKDIDLMLRNTEGLTHTNLTYGQALFTSDRGQTDLQNLNLQDRERVKKMYSDYKTFIEKLRKDVFDWKYFESIGSTEYTHLAIYRIGNYITIKEAEDFLKENEMNLLELEKIALAYTNVNYGHSQKRDTPYDYSVRNLKTNNL